MARHTKSLKGQLLLDNGKLVGSFFHRTVLLICEHDAEGAFGLVLNRNTGTTVGDALVADLPDSLKELPLYLGGPVQPQALSYIHAEAITSDDLMAHLHVGHSIDGLQEIADVWKPSLGLRVFAGYAGWSPGQLDDEMRRDTWLTHPASAELVFQTDPEVLWPMILRQKGWKYRLEAAAPLDPSLN